jgi:hypothetical protein
MTRFLPLLLLAVAACTQVPASFSLAEGDNWDGRTVYDNFEISGQALADSGATAVIGFCRSTDNSGYEMIIHNEVPDGSLKTGSLHSVRNLYRSLANDGEWFDFSVAVRGKNIGIRINGVDVVCYTEPEAPWRDSDHAGQLIAPGTVGISCRQGNVRFRNLAIVPLPGNARNPGDTLPPVDESSDGIIRLQQRDFPVIDYHVHLKGDLTKEMAHAMSMNYGINYGVAPNAGEGGVGRMLADDAEVYAYYEEIAGEPFLFGVQGEGRRWTQTFSQEALGIVEYLFTDAMTIVDHKGRLSRIYRPEEVFFDDIDEQGYMDHLVDQTVLILTNEPADIYANPTFIPDALQPDYDKLWTPERVDRILDVLGKYQIALEINPRYCIPSFDIIRRAKARGIKFTFGTNNVDSRFGRLEYALQAIDSCSLTPDDIWFPSMSIRSSRPTVIYNHFE